MDVDLDRHLWALHENGFTVFDALFSVEQLDRWKSSFERLIQEGELSGGGGSRCVRDLVERDPSAALPLITNATLLGFAEQLILAGDRQGPPGCHRRPGRHRAAARFQ